MQTSSSHMAAHDYSLHANFQGIVSNVVKINLKVTQTFTDLVGGSSLHSAQQSCHLISIFFCKFPASEELPAIEHREWIFMPTAYILSSFSQAQFYVSSRLHLHDCIVNDDATWCLSWRMNNKISSEFGGRDARHLLWGQSMDQSNRHSILSQWDTCRRHLQRPWTASQTQHQ